MVIKRRKLYKMNKQIYFPIYSIHLMINKRKYKKTYLPPLIQIQNL